MSKDFLAKLQAQRAQQANGQTGAAVAPTAPTVFDLMAEVTGGKLSPARAALINSVLVRGDDGALMFDDVRLSPVGLVIPNDGIDKSMATGLLDFLFSLEGSIQWMIGDILAYGEQCEWGEFYSDVMKKYNRQYFTVADYKYVSANVPFSVRTEKLTFGHHKRVASMSEDLQALWLDVTARCDWSVAVMRQYIAQLKDWDIETQRAWLEVVERDKLTPEQLREAIAEAAGVKKPAKPTAAVKQQLTYAAYLSNVVKRFGVELDGVESDTIKHAVKAAREVMAMASAIIEKHGGKS